MPVDIRSRYWVLNAYPAPTGDGPTPTLPIRPNVEIAESDTVAHRLSGVENVEYLAWRYYGRSQVWWRICDGNPLAFPLDYRPGVGLRVASAGSINRVVRTRNF
ncbi:hypothetical protein [Sphingomonas sp.]|jgi:hypothetical protein|uniref:hypothetical protein n=1 Tax=Sphingomonas sp. TaxID=28214 RepID=UPI002E30DC1C|nr:hypothetical protein [Sphingomonas sp.]HEX4694637.1 hypothetical protein [Sphingomonas sp.]